MTMSQISRLLLLLQMVVGGDDNRMTTCLENLEMSGNLTAVEEMSGNFTKNHGNFRKKILSGKSCLKLFIVNCIFALNSTWLTLWRVDFASAPYRLATKTKGSSTFRQQS